MDERFWSASTEEMKRGYVWDEVAGTFMCLICGTAFEKGVIYQSTGVFYEAERFVRVHIAEEHGSTLNWLLGLDKRWTGLTDLQRRLIELFYQGLSDEEIVREQGGSKSTIRNHRFTLREKMKQAKVLLSIMELVEEKAESPSRFVPVQQTATLHERYAVTEKESSDILRTYFKSGLEGPLSEFPKKEKRKIVILRHLMKRFEGNKSYTEKQVNEVLKQAYDDHVTLRRYLIEYGFMHREPDGSRYWVKQEGMRINEEETTMDHQRRKQLVESYKQTIPSMGIFQIKNLRNGKLYLVSSPNLDKVHNREKFMLEQGTHMNKELQRDWNELGEEAFSFEIVDRLKLGEDDVIGPDTTKKYQEDLKLLEQLWLEKLQPYGENGYHKQPVKRG